MAEYLIQDTTLSEIADAIRMKTGKDDPIPVTSMAAEISSISVDGGDVVLRYITFMSYDGTVEYGKKAVVYGDDCADPVSLGLFETPTREYTAQYNYTFNGWSSEPEGGVDANIFKDVRENKTVYANFISTLRYYTITFYDSDGTTVLKTQSLAYGSMPSYTPVKEGHSFNGWSPTLTTVTDNASYSASWIVQITFAGGSWADIAAISEAGEAANYFSLGDSRTVPVTINGTTYNFTARIVGFNHDTKTDGSKAGLSIMFFTVPETKYSIHTSAYTSSTSKGYAQCSLYTTLANTFLYYLPADLRSVIKTVNKQYNMPQQSTALTTTAKLWVPSAREILTDTNFDKAAGTYTPTLNTQYQYFKNESYGRQYGAYKIYNTANKLASSFLLRDASTNSVFYYTMYLTYSPSTMYNDANKLHYLPLGFCV